jgi:hypothetical protein
MNSTVTGAGSPCLDKCYDYPEISARPPIELPLVDFVSSRQDFSLNLWNSASLRENIYWNGRRRSSEGMRTCVHLIFVHRNAFRRIDAKILRRETEEDESAEKCINRLAILRDDIWRFESRRSPTAAAWISQLALRLCRWKAVDFEWLVGPTDRRCGSRDFGSRIGQFIDRAD